MSIEWVYVSVWQIALVALLSVLLLFVIAWAVMLNWRTYKERRTKEVVVPQYEPPDGLEPIVLSKLLIPHVAPREIVAEVLDLVMRGSIVLSTSPGGDTFLTKTSHTPQLTKFEQQFIEVLFAQKESLPASALLLDKTVDERISTLIVEYINNDIYPKYYTKGSVRLASWSAGIGLGMFVLGLVGILFPPLLFAIPFGFIFLLSSTNLLQKNAEGRRVFQQILGYKEYLATAEVERINFHAIPGASGKLDKHLPYVVALGFEHKWSSAFTPQTLEVFKLYESQLTK